MKKETPSWKKIRRRNSEAIVNDGDDEKNNDDEDEEEEDAEAAREANEAARAAEIELEEEREEEARKALKAKQELETQEMEAKIAREEIQEEEEEEEELEEDEETRALKQRLADAEAEHATLDALDKANEEAIAMLNRHDEKDDKRRRLFRRSRRGRERGDGKDEPVLDVARGEQRHVL